MCTSKVKVYTCLGRRPIPDGAETAEVHTQEVAKLALDPSATAPETHTFASAGASHLPLIVPSFPFLLVRCASSLHIILFPPLLLAAFFLLLCAYFFSAAQPYNPHSYIYRHIFAVVWQTQHTWRCNLSSNLRRADFHSGAYTSTICMTLVYLQV